MSVPVAVVRALIAGSMFFATLVVVAGPASADSPGCVTGAEFRRIDKGMTRMRVQRIFDTKGRSLFRNPGAVHNSARTYRMCVRWRRGTGHSQVQIQFNNYATRGGPQRVVHKQHY